MDINGYIQDIKDMAGLLPGIQEQRRGSFLKRAEQIRERADNPCLHVALIGDFSAGKSTFINAFLRQDILKTAWHATTAAPTYIYPGGWNEIRIMVETPEGERYRLEDQAQCARLEKRLGIRLPSGTKDILALLSASNDVAGSIKRIGVWTPGPEELRHICVIDTPGVNPGAEEAAFHAARTRKVLGDYADAVIVLFQETQVFSGSFKKFLQENTIHFMNEAIFVITMMDLAEEGEREALTEYVRLQLKQTFGMEKPPVFGCCAKAALSGKTDAESRYWTERFDELRDTIIGYMSRRREKIIRRQLALLLEKLLAEMDGETVSALSGIEQKRENMGDDMTGRERRFREEKLMLQSLRYEKMHQRLLGYLEELREEGSGGG